MIKNYSETTPIVHELFPVSNKQIELSFSGDDISSDGGLLLLREVENQTGLINRISNCITDNRDQRYVDHTIREMLTQRVFQIAAGYEDCNDCDDLRDDMIFKTCAGRLPQTGLSLASQPTMSRLENSIKSQDLYRIGQELVDTFVESYDREPGVIILDCDDTNNNTYGQQELDEAGNPVDGSTQDPLYTSAVRVVVSEGRASTSLLQRRLSIGYGRAAKLVDMMFHNGLVGPAEGSKPREVLVGLDFLDRLEEP